jgi:hypothetical protein
VSHGEGAGFVACLKASKHGGGAGGCRAVAQWQSTCLADARTWVLLPAPKDKHKEELEHSPCPNLVL